MENCGFVRSGAMPRFFSSHFLSVETPPFRAVESEFIWEGRNPFQTRTAHRATLYVSSCVLKRHLLNSYLLLKVV